MSLVVECDYDYMYAIKKVIEKSLTSFNLLYDTEIQMNYKLNDATIRVRSPNCLDDDLLRITLQSVSTSIINSGIKFKSIKFA